MNPRPAGASGVQFLEGSASSFPAVVLDHFNLVSFDPRGVGQSDPVRCVTSLSPYLRYTLASARADSGLLSGTAGRRRQELRGRLRGPHVPRPPRQCLQRPTPPATWTGSGALSGRRSWIYLGFSYGTYLGTVYAEMFPAHVGAMVLDGAIDPALSTEAGDLVQAEGFEGDLQRLLRLGARPTPPARGSCPQEPRRSTPPS